jgi:hypothetical protein
VLDQLRATCLPVPRRRRSLHALVIPADPARPCLVQRLPLSTTALSDAIGGGVLETVVISAFEDSTFQVYADRHRKAKKLPDNQRAILLSARLGCIQLVDRIRLRGDILLTGVDDSGNDLDVPYAVFEAAFRSRILPCPFPR